MAKAWKSLLVVVVVAVVLSVGILAMPQGTAEANPGTIYVPDNFTTIQQAVNNATSGDTIIVRDGTYHENVDVNKTLTIQSENGAANCVVNASNPDAHVFEVTAAWVNITGFTVENATDWPNAGIYLNEASHCNISSNNIANNTYGVYLESSSNNTIYNNYFDNTNNAWDDGTNTWNTTNTTGPNIVGGPYLGGNYWNDYTTKYPNATEIDSTGFWDTPYNITGNSNKDYLPLVLKLATLEGHVSFPGRGSPPDSRWIESFNVTLFEPGNLSHVLWTGNAITNGTGVFTINGIAPDTYDVSIKNWTCLSEVNTSVALTVGNTTVVDFGTTREGDANNDDWADFDDRILLYQCWNAHQGGSGYECYCDFNRDGWNDFDDRILLYDNWNQPGDLV